MINTWFVLLPAFLVLGITITTKKLNYALMAGIIAASLIAKKFALIASLLLAFQRFAQQLTNADNIYQYLFLFLLGIIITVLEHNGGAAAFARAITKHLRSKKSAETASALISTTLFMDDYLSCLVTGYVMRPVTDSFKITRTKLAFLIHSLSSPLVILAPVSSWIAIITSQIGKAGISPVAGDGTRLVAEPFLVYLKAIPFIFYSLLMIAALWFIIRRRISYGPMHQEEVIAQKTGNLFGGQTPLTPTASTLEPQETGTALDLLLPIGTLVITFIAGVAWSGGYRLFGSVSFIEALQHTTQTSLMLLLAAIITLALSIARGIYRHALTYKKFHAVAGKGFLLMESSVNTVILASIFGLIMREDLQVGTYIATTFLQSIHLVFLPLIFYLTATLIALITGSAWGTIALLVPLSVQMLITITHMPLEAVLYPILGAIFSGAVCGNHLSPIAENTIMSATSAGCYPLAHVYTQLWYALPAFIGAGVSFIVSGYMIGSAYMNIIFVSLGSGLVCCCILLLLAQAWQNTSIQKES